MFALRLRAALRLCGKQFSIDRHGGKQKKLQTCKPDSVLRLPGVSAIYLMPAVARGICAAYPPCISRTGKMCEQHMEQGVHGISTRKVCPSGQLPARSVRSYRTFSPLPRLTPGLLFSVTLSMPRRQVGGTPPVRWCGALCCPDFPPRKAAERSVVVL